MADSEITVDVAVTRTPVEDPDPAPMMETLVEAPACEIPPSPLDFDVLTLSELGISTQSFLPSSNRKNKSRLAQLKQRRRSSVGVRGSPETNSLIRYQALQRMKTPPTTPESFRASPSLPRFSSTLKQKMASFQSLVDVKENVMLGTSPSGQDNLIGQCIKTRDYLSDGRSQVCSKENSDPENTPPIKRARCTTPIEECAEEIRGVNAPILKHTPLKPHKVTVLQDRVWLTQPLTPRAQAENQPANTAFLSPSQPAGGQVLVYESQPSSLTHCTPTKTQQESLFEVQSPSQAQANGSLPGRPADRDDVFVMPSLPVLNPTDCGDRPGNSTAKKRVRFGAPLSPEYFDRTLPPSTPLHKGSTPAGPSTAGSQLRSLLKTPQRSELPSTPAASDLTSPCLTGGSPLLSTGPHGGIALGVEGDDTYTLGKIAFPTLEDTDSPLVDNTAAEVNLEIQALDLNAAFQEDSVSEALLVDPAPETESVSEPVLEPGPPSELEDVGTTALEPGPPSELKDVGTTALEPVQLSEPPEDVDTTALEPGPPPEPEDLGTNAPASGSKNGKRKRKPTDEEQTVRRSTRAAVSGKMKKPSEKRAWSKKVNLLLYPSREYASKSPALSPVTETLSKSPALSPVTETLHGPSHTPTSDHRRTRRRTAEEEDPTNDTSAHTLGTADTSVMDPCGGASGSRPRTPAVRGGRRKVSVPSDDWLSGGSEKTEDQTTAIPEDQTTAIPEDQTTAVPEDQTTAIPEDQTTAVPEVPESGPSNLGTTDASASDPCDGASEAPVDPSTDTPGRATRSGRTPSRSGSKTPVDKIKGRGRRRKVTVPSDDCLREEPGQTEDTTTTNPEVPVSGPSEHTEAPAEQDTIRVADCLTTLCPSSDVDITEERAEHDTAQAIELPPGEEVGVGEQQHTANREEDGGGLHHSEESDPSLPPWQRGDFNIDDVLRPAANSRKNPVRRSLRNQASREDGNSSGLAWLPHTSPESIRTVRRRSRGLHSTGKRPQKS